MAADELMRTRTDDEVESQIGSGMLRRTKALNQLQRKENRARNEADSEQNRNRNTWNWVIRSQQKSVSALDNIFW